MGHSMGSAPPGAVVVYANELEFFGDVSTGNIKRWVFLFGGMCILLDLAAVP